MKNGKMSLKEKIRNRAKQREGHNRGNSMFNLPADMGFLEVKKSMRLDVVPYKVSVLNHPEASKGELWYERTFFTHRGIGPEQSTVICPSTIGKKCPICEEYNKLRKDPEADEEGVRALRRSEREMFNVIDADDPKKGVQLFTMSTAMFGDKLEEEVREGDDDIASFPFLKGGKTLSVRFREKALGKSKFWECSKITFEDRDIIDEDILEEVADLDKIMNIQSYEQLEKLFLQTEGDEEEDEEESPKKKVKKARRDEDEDEEDTDEEEETPKSKKKVKKDEDEDDDDEDSDDDDGDDESDEEDSDPDEDESDDEEDDEDSDEDSDGDEDESSDDSDDDDSDEDDEPPAKSKKSKKPSKDEDEDEEDDDEDSDEDSDDDTEDEDEEEAPRSRRNRK